jgi:hypothetical protein
MAKTFILIISLILLVGCTSGVETPPPTPTPLPASDGSARVAAEQAVFRALLDENLGYVGGPHLLLRRDSVNIAHFFSTTAESDQTLTLVREEIPDISPEAWADFAAQNATPSDLTSLVVLERPFTLVSQEEVMRFFQNEGGTVEARWEAFYNEYPESGGYTEVARIGFNGDLTQAVAYTEIWCGAECGAGAIVVLARDGEGWVKVGERVMWVA